MVQDILKKCTVEDNVVKLPAGQLERKLYMEVAKQLELIGGKWKGGKVMGFVFKENPADLLEQIANGEKRNLKKEFQFFATPDSIADELVRWAEIEDDDIILEPSAGQGAIIKAIHRAHPKHLVNYCELMELNRSILTSMPHTQFRGEDFLKYDGGAVFSIIIANPPFSKNQDIDHIYKMWEVLKPGGRIVTISSTHWMHCNNKKERTFEEWLYNEAEASVNGFDAGAFSESGTSVKTNLIIIHKPKS